jgi:hypothetical protein
MISTAIAVTCSAGKDPGPRLEAIGRSLVENKRTSVASGHGIGKTGLSADAIHWFISTRPHPAIVATANTEDQLQKKLWRELNLVNQQAKNREWFDWKVSTFTMFEDPTAQAVALAWSEQNSEAFAGTHAEHVLGVFDEASAIPKIIFTVFNGAMTTPGARWLAVGNSTRNEGYFFDITHGKYVARRPEDMARGMWNAFVVPSWESPFVTEEWLREWELGENCDRLADPTTWTMISAFASPACRRAPRQRPSSIPKLSQKRWLARFRCFAAGPCCWAAMWAAAIDP